MCFPTVEDCKGAFSFTPKPICNTCVRRRQKYGRGGCQHILLWRGHTRRLSGTTCLTRVTDEHKVCDGVCSHLSAEKMSKQIHPWCRPRVLIMRSIFCNRGQSVRQIYYVCMNMEEKALGFNWFHVKKMQLHLLFVHV